ncbi:VOC family protein [Geodermatophilus sp. SYSU D01180]
MTRTVQRVLSVSVRVADQDRALAWYRDVLGCEVVRDVELGPGARWLEVAPPGSPVTVALLTEEGGIPISVRYAAGRRPGLARGAHRGRRLAGRGARHRLRTADAHDGRPGRERRGARRGGVTLSRRPAGRTARRRRGCRRAAAGPSGRRPRG